MKKTCALTLFLGIITSSSAQLLFRSETLKEDKKWVEKHFYIHLDTLPAAKFISVNFNHCRNKSCNATISIGDGFTWKWIDATLKPIEIKDYVDGLNKLSQFNWTLHMPIYRQSSYDGTGHLTHDWLLKRKE